MNFSNNTTNQELSEKSFLTTFEMFKQTELMTIQPTTMIIPFELREFLATQGYDTKEKVNQLINKIAEKLVLKGEPV